MTPTTDLVPSRSPLKAANHAMKTALQDCEENDNEEEEEEEEEDGEEEGENAKGDREEEEKEKGKEGDTKCLEDLI